MFYLVNSILVTLVLVMLAFCTQKLKRIRERDEAERKKSEIELNILAINEPYDNEQAVAR